MIRSVRTFAAALACAMTAGAWHPAGATAAAGANVPMIDAPTACATEFTVTTVEGDSNAVVAHARDLAGPFTGTITAYGADRIWTAAIDRSALVEPRYGGRENSVIVRADAPIEGLEYTPAWAPCTFHAGTSAPSGYEPRVAERPTLTVASPQPIERAACAHPYVAPKVTRVVDPVTPAQSGGGTVTVAVALDERGIPRYTRIIGLPDPALNPSAVNAAKRSEYQGAVFRCKPVPSGYEFTVQYVQ